MEGLGFDCELKNLEGRPYEVFKQLKCKWKPHSPTELLTIHETRETWLDKLDRKLDISVGGRTSSIHCADTREKNDQKCTVTYEYPQRVMDIHKLGFDTMIWYSTEDWQPNETLEFTLVYSKLDDNQDIGISFGKTNV